MTILNTIPEQVDADDLMALAWSLPLKQEHITRQENAYAALEAKGIRVQL